MILKFYYLLSKTLTVVFLSLFVLINIAFSQEIFRFNKIGLKDGLPSGTAPLSFTQDNIGFIWFPVLGGVVKYDGYEFHTYNTFIGVNDTVFYPEIFYVFEDNNKDLWAAGKNILGKYNRKKDSFYFYKIKDESTQSSLPSVYCVQEGKNGMFWLSSDDMGLFSFDTISKKFQQFNHTLNNTNSINSDTLSDIVIDDSGELWISFFTKGLCKYEKEKDKFIRFSSNEMSSYNIVSDSIHALCKDNKGSIWIAFKNRVIAELNPVNNDIKYFYITGENINPSAIITTIFVDNNDLVWIGTYREGVILFNKETNNFIGIKRDDMISENDINYAYSIFQDKTGLIWIGDLEALHTYSKNSQVFINYSDDEFFNKMINNAGIQDIKSVNKKDIWLATTNGLYKWQINSNSFDHYLKDNNPNRDPKQFGSNSVSNIFFDSKGNLWAATFSGLYKFDTTSMSYVNFKHNPNDSFTMGPDGPDNIYEDKFAVIWISTDNTIDKYDNGNKTFKHYNIATVRSFFEDSDGILWACSGSRGIYKYKREKDIFEEFYDERTFRGFSMITEDDNKNLWAASFYSGINYFDENSIKFQSFSIESGLPSGFVNNLIKDNSGMLWLTNRLGISRFDPERKQFKNFGEPDGLKIKDFLTTSVYKSPDGRIFMGGKNGMVSFYPAPLNQITPNVVFTDLKIHDISVIPSDTSVLKSNINVTEEIELSYSDNSLTFEYCALDFKDPSKNKYSFKMEGFENEWSQFSIIRTAHYTNLNPGEYTFRVKGTNDDGVFNEQGTSLKILILPPWWKTWWFTVIWIISLALLFGLTIRFITARRYKKKLDKIRQQQVIEKERLRISNDMHDEVGSSLTRITLLSEIAKSKLGESEEIRKISEASREVVNNMDEIVWAVNPRNDSLESLTAYIIKYAQEFYEGTGIICRFNIPSSIQNIALSSDTRHNVFLTVKESLNNILKHSGATEVIIQLKIENETFKFSIIDNGKGFNITEIDRFSNGLNSMRKRINDIGGEFSINSFINTGTSIVINIPFINN